MSEKEIVWRDVRTLTVEGQGWADRERAFDRLPARAKGKVPPAVWELARNSAGIAVRFQTDATEIHARWTLMGPRSPLDHMAASGTSGLDLYAREAGGAWRWAGVGRCSAVPKAQAVLAERMDAGRREYMLYLPLYDGVESVEVGVPAGADLAAAPARAGRPIVFYGTSIVQGACASRAGMGYTSILGRRLDRPVINLGFSGSARCEAELADLLGELDAGVFVLDPLPNMDAAAVTERIEPFVRALRAARAGAPIVLVECISYPLAAQAPWLREHLEAINAALRAAIGRLRASGETNLHLVNGAALLGGDGEATVDGVHPTDVGMMRMADAIEPALRALA
ncbi:MAG: SGNH/GDSL hydrolase family protein [Planctomycetota bacterium]|nr:SGNH/GDSL hydrolase family protein [Planctomycetota bacterium]